MAEREGELLEVLREIRDDQRRILAALEAESQEARRQREESLARLDASTAMQRELAARAARVAWVAIPLILACVGLIAYLVVRYL